MHKAKFIPANTPGFLAVAGFLFKVTDKDNPNVEAIVKALFNVRKSGQKTKLKDKRFNVSLFMNLLSCVICMGGDNLK